MFRRLKLGLQDCRVHGVESRAELLIVEGDSASQAACALRDPEFQAVLPMQGKPANALKASARALRENVLFGELREALGYGATQNAKLAAEIDPSHCRYSRVLLLFDPDADGIHGGALMLIYFYQQFRGLLMAGRVAVIRPPLFELSYCDSALPDAPRMCRFAYTQEEFQQLQRELNLAGAVRLTTQRMRGLGGMPTELLRSSCIDPKTRNVFRLNVSDAESAIAIFGGG